MGSPLGSIFAGTIMVQLFSFLKGYVHDTYTFVNEKCITFVLEQLNSYHETLLFTYELETERTLPFLDVPVIRKCSRFKITVYRKSTNIDIYLYWFLHVPSTSQRRMLTLLLNHAYKLYSTDYYPRQELCYLEKIFIRNNTFPRCVVIHFYEKHS